MAGGKDMIKRERYMMTLRTYRNKPLIKVLTGLRRAGKSSLLLLLQEELLANGIKPAQIIWINFDNMDFFDLRDAKSLHNYLKIKMTDMDFYYVLIDEVQESQGWEQVVNSLLSEGKSDIYLTGSNSQMLSSDLATYIAGRYIEIPVSTLSFAEALDFRKAYSDAPISNMTDEINNYIRTGGFPAVYTGHYNYQDIYQIVKDIYSSAVLRDVVQRLNLRNVDLLERVLRFVFDNIGNIFSTRNIAAYFISQQRKVDQSTIFHYLNALSEAFIINRIRRYDIQGKEILQTNEKYYLGDISLAYAAFGFKDRMISGILENIVLLELQRRGYVVYVGKSGDKEIDFVAEKQNSKFYVQVAYKISDSAETVSREFAPLLALKDQYPKYVVTLDNFWQDNIEGVKHVYLPDFLLMETYV
jgi:predicted AAA+ superfamily ATPase